MRGRLRILDYKQQGFTLIELIVALAIAGILIVGIGTTIFQIIIQNGRATRDMQAILNVENAGYWMSHDALMAQTMTSSGFPLILGWQDWDGNFNEVTYALTNGYLQRSLSINGGASTATLIAQGINADSAMTNYQFVNGVVTFKITSTIGPTSEARTYNIKLRPESVIE